MFCLDIDRYGLGIPNPNKDIIFWGRWLMRVANLSHLLIGQSARLTEAVHIDQAPFMKPWQAPNLYCWFLYLQ